MSQLTDYCAKLAADAEHALRVARQYVAAREQWERVAYASRNAPGELTELERAADALQEAEAAMDQVSVESLAMNVTALVARVGKAEVENAKLRDALKPFADLGKRFETSINSGGERDSCPLPNSEPLTMGDVRRAAELLASPAPPATEGQA